MRLAVLVSGSGTNLQAILDRARQGSLTAQVAVVFSNNPDAGGLERARRAGVPAEALNHKDFADRAAFDAAVVDILRRYDVDAVALAGYMRLLTPGFLAAFPGRVINIHPALLPSFPGTHGQADAQAYGVRIAGCTVHFVDEAMDSGPIIIQAAVPALATDTAQSLAERILTLEHRIYPQALQWLADDRLRVDGRKVVLRPSSKPRAFESTACEQLVCPPLEDGF